MTGKLRAAVYLTLVLALSFLVVSLSNRDVDATTWEAIYITTQEGTGANVPLGNPDTKAIYNQPGPNANFGRIDNVAAAVTSDVAADADIVDGLAVGGIRSQTTLGLLNQACATPIIVVTPFMEGSADITNTADFVGDGTNLILDDDGDGTEGVAIDGTGRVDYNGDTVADDADDGGPLNGFLFINGYVDIDEDGIVQNTGETAGHDTGTITLGGDSRAVTDGLIAGATPVGTPDADDTNGVPTYGDHYPSFLNTLFTSPITGDPVEPLARYVGHTQVLNGAPTTQLNFVIFAPGALGDPNTGVGLPESTMEESFGYVLRVVLNNEAAAAAPSTITNFCTTLSTVTTLSGVTTGEMIVMPGPAPYEVEGSVAQCGAASGVSNPLVNPANDDDDGDGFIDDGCLRIPDPCVGVDYDGDTTVTVADGEDEAGDGADDDDSDGTTDEGCFGTSSDASGAVRLTNPAAGTGVYDTGTHISRSYSSGIRDADGDGLDNGLDSCQTIATTNTDADFDGLDDAPGCDPNTGAGSTTAQSPNGIDDDGDTVIDEDPVNNADDDGDTQLDEDGECSGVSGLPDEDQDCYANRLDNCALVANDQSDLDEDPTAADAGTPGDGIGDACDPNPPVGESGGQCGNNFDEDGDTLVNDGCPTVTVGSCPGAPPPVGTCQDRPEVGAECGEKAGTAVDDDGDGTINDGCPAAGGGIADGHYHSNAPLAYSCISLGNDGLNDTNANNDPDDDDDGVCDKTEEFLGSCPRDTCDAGKFPNLTDLNGDNSIDAADSTPEFMGLVYSALPADQDGDTVIDQSPSICNDHVLYGHPDGAEVDNDGDGDANAADSGCQTAPVVGEEDGAGPGTCNDGIDNGDGDGADDADASFDCDDIDKDGIANAADNCPYHDNPEQSDRVLATPAGDDCEGIDADGDFDGDTVNDAVDPDRDGDGYFNSDESNKRSNGFRANSKPEHCDAADNDGDTVVDEAPAGSGRATSDPLCNPAADPDGDNIPNSADDDDDGDGVFDIFERGMSTDELSDCSKNSSHDAWPSDFDKDTDADPGDNLGLFFFSMGEKAGDPFYSRRADFEGDGDNDPGDNLAFFFFFIGTKCLEFTFTNNTGSDVDDIEITFSAALVRPNTAVDSDVEGWGPGALSVGNTVLDLERPDPEGDLANGGTLRITVIGPPNLTVSSCQWTLDTVNKGAC